MKKPCPFLVSSFINAAEAKMTFNWIEGIKGVDICLVSVPELHIDLKITRRVMQNHPELLFSIGQLQT